MPAVVVSTKQGLAPQVLELAIDQLTPDGKGSSSVTFARSPPAPTLETVTVKPTWLPAETVELSATLVTATSGAVETWPRMKSERVEVDEVDDRVSTTNELKLKGPTWFGKRLFRSTPASKNSPAWT